jgi:hypothetical protein
MVAYSGIAQFSFLRMLSENYEVKVLEGLDKPGC